jgi:2-keto-4-pentenoate hydratase/2-oxohepta-3-ene-1,7-dioic acid hydratase in catechol pathway
VKIAVFDSARVGVVEGDSIYDVTAAVPDAGIGWPAIFIDRLIDQWPSLQAKLMAERRTMRAVPLSSVTLEAPNPCPIHILAAPANYRRHVAEMLDQRGSGKTMRELGFFIKTPASILRPGGTVILPKGSARRFDHESELAVVIGRTCKNVPIEQALDVVFGYACLMDLTLRLTEDSSEERVMRKSFDTFTPLGPWIVTADEIPDPQHLAIDLWVNDELRQHANTADMTVPIAEQISYISSVMTLHPGDIIATGTPDGVGPMRPGDTVRIRIEKIGDFSVQVAEASEVAPKVF